MRALATPRSGLATIIGSSVPVVMSANVSAVPSRNIAASTIADADGAGRDRQTQHGQHDRPRPVDGDHDPPPVVAVGDHAGVQAEQQPRQALEQPGERDQEWVTGLRRHQQRAGGDGDPVPEVADPRRRQQPSEARPHPRRCDDVEHLVHR